MNSFARQEMAEKKDTKTETIKLMHSFFIMPLCSKR